MVHVKLDIEIEITEDSEVCRKGKEVILGDEGLAFHFEDEDQSKQFRLFIDFR